jgi:hypothetical protein
VSVFFAKSIVVITNPLLPSENFAVSMEKEGRGAIDSCLTIDLTVTGVNLDSERPIYFIFSLGFRQKREW